jgi:hypothetical protein
VGPENLPLPPHPHQHSNPGLSSLFLTTAERYEGHRKKLASNWKEIKMENNGAFHPLNCIRLTQYQKKNSFLCLLKYGAAKFNLFLLFQFCVSSVNLS